MSRGEDVLLRFGEGRISGVASIFLGALSVLAVLCFHFPEYLTTPELRQSYDVEVLRGVLLGAMILSLLLGGLSLLLSSLRRSQLTTAGRLGFVGIALALAAQWMGGATVYVDDFEQPASSFGLDWLILALLSNTLVFVFIERIYPHRREQRVLRRQWKLDVVYFVFNHLMVSVALLITTVFSEGLFGWAVNAQLQALIRSQPVWLQFIEVLVVADFTQYWGHRWMHESPVLWNFHAVHHCPAEMDWLSGSRMHFLEVLFTRSTVILPIYLLGFAESAINAYVVWVSVQAVLIHSNTRIEGGPLRRVFATPHFHHWHHAADAEAIDHNYASALPVLDMIFGTYLGNHGRWPERYGVVGKRLPKSFVAQHLYPFMASSDSGVRASPHSLGPDR